MTGFRMRSTANAGQVRVRVRVSRICKHEVRVEVGISVSDRHKKSRQDHHKTDYHTTTQTKIKIPKE